MKCVLITGLDGSGKSSLLNRLDALGHPNKAILRVPKVDAEIFSATPSLYKTALFINTMHDKADTLKMPVLKSVALFSAMLVFKELINELEQRGTNLVFCERHPLIDTAVYARFYIGKMDPNSLDHLLAENIEKQYRDELQCLLKLQGIGNPSRGPLSELLHAIHDWFTVNKKYQPQDLQQLFDLKKPDAIIYLSASPEILMQRLAERKVLEPHESLETFKKLVPVYEQVLGESGIEIMRVDANSFEKLDAAYDSILRRYY